METIVLLIIGMIFGICSIVFLFIRAQYDINLQKEIIDSLVKKIDNIEKEVERSSIMPTDDSRPLNFFDFVGDNEIKTNWVSIKDAIKMLYKYLGVELKTTEERKSEVILVEKEIKK